MSEEALTVERLKSLPFRLKQHLNGGSKFSVMVKDNEEFGLVYSYRTNGSPKYEYESRTIETTDGEIVADLLSNDFDGELSRFVEAYNARKVAG